MNKIIKKLKPHIICFFILLLYIFIWSILTFNNVISLDTFLKVNFVILGVINFILGFHIGKHTTNKGYIQGLKSSGFIVLMLLLFNLIFFRCISLNTIIYYILIIIILTFGSIIGINLKKKN